MKEYKGKQKTAKSLLKGGCYAKGGRVGKADKESMKEKRAEKKEKEVGKIDGMAKGGRLDKAPRKSKTQVNVIVGAKDKQPVPIPVPVSGAGGGGDGGPPMAGGMSPPGAQQGPMKRGGTVKKQKRAAGGRVDSVKPASSKVPKFEGGAGGGLGRLEKAKDAKKK